MCGDNLDVSELELSLLELDEQLKFNNEKEIPIPTLAKNLSLLMIFINDTLLNYYKKNLLF
jgi:hypothetical protein